MPGMDKDPAVRLWELNREIDSLEAMQRGAIQIPLAPPLPPLDPDLEADFQRQLYAEKTELPQRLRKLKAERQELLDYIDNHKK